MKAAVCYEFGKALVVEEVDLAPIKRDEVRVKVVATAVCHSDIHLIRGDLGDVLGGVPVIAGHESAGYVEEVGEDVTSVKPGDHVVTSVLRSCGECFYCRTGLPHLCRTKPPVDQESPIRNKNGQGIIRMEKVAGFAEYVNADASAIAKLPEDMPFDRASLLACGVITGFGAVVNRAQVEPLSSVVVIGTGGVGLNAIQGAAFAGAHPVIAVDVLDNKLEAARKFGATHTVNSSKEDPVEAIKDLTSGAGADYAFVTVGNTDAITQAVSMTRPRGMTVIVGIPPMDKGTFTLSAFDFFQTERVLTGVFMGSTNLRVQIPKLVRLYQDGRLKLDELITKRYNFDDINEAIETVERGEALRNILMF